jgi:hypothetical protein
MYSSSGTTASTETEIVGAAQIAIKPIGPGEDAQGLHPSNLSGLANPGGFAGSDVSREQLIALGFNPRRESYTPCIASSHLTEQYLLDICSLSTG